MTRPYAPLGLLQGDRLEVGYSISDLAEFENLTVFPATVLWWRRSKETRCRFRCPLFSPKIGLDSSRLAIDAMHTVYLGIAGTWVVESIWCLFRANAWRVQQPAQEHEVFELSAMFFKNELFAWYRERQQQGVPDDWTTLESFDLNFVGKNSKPSWSGKAAETKTILPFMLLLLQRKRDQVAGQQIGFLIAAGQSLLRWIDLVAQHPDCPSVVQAQEQLDSMKRFVVMCQKAGIPQKPKAHLALHLSQRAHREGNCRLYMTWQDETENRHLASIGRSGHRAVWELRILEHYERLVSKRKQPAS